jgi:nucleotide-binding universal stress UspA family protein
MLVMGAYSHSRAREFVFGGVTRYMMQSAQLPLLLAH